METCKQITDWNPGNYCSCQKCCDEREKYFLKHQDRVVGVGKLGKETYQQLKDALEDGICL